MEKINIAELLKNCPQGMKMYSPIFGDVYLNKIRPHLAIVVTIDKKDSDVKEEFLYDGRYSTNGECMLFPSKDRTTWKGFIPPYNFKDGDIVATENGDIIGITIGGEINKFIPTYCIIIKPDNKFKAYIDTKETWLFNRLATEEEKKKLFDAIRENGYKWNSETKTLEKLVKPKFKVGDRVKKNKDYISGIVTDIYKDSFKVSYISGCCSYVQFYYQDEWELVSNKFDISTLVPFESKVLVRDCETQIWKPAIYGGYIEERDRHKYVIVGGISFEYLIPYKNNEHLRCKTDNCKPYYKTWEK